MKREKKGVLWGVVVLKALNDDFRVSKHQKGANVMRTEVSGEVEGINTSNKFRLIGGNKRCSGGEASDFFSKMVTVYSSTRAPFGDFEMYVVDAVGHSSGFCHWSLPEVPYLSFKGYRDSQTTLFPFIPFRTFSVFFLLLLLLHFFYHSSLITTIMAASSSNQPNSLLPTPSPPFPDDFIKKGEEKEKQILLQLESLALLPFSNPDFLIYFPDITHCHIDFYGIPSNFKEENINHIIFNLFKSPTDNLERISVGQGPSGSLHHPC